MKYGERKEQIMALIRERGAVALSDIKAHCGMTTSNASVTMLDMLKRGHVKREGEKRAYRYSLP